MNTSPETQKPKRRRLSIKRIGMVFVWLATLWVLLAVIQNWTGARAWKAYVKELEASGGSLDFDSVSPPRISDEDNFFEAPFIKALLHKAPETERFQPRGDPYFKNDGSDSYYMNNGDWSRGEFVDLEMSRQYYRQFTTSPMWKEHYEKLSEDSPIPQSPAEEILYVMSLFDDELEGLKEASKRPGSRFPIDLGQSGQSPTWNLNSGFRQLITLTKARSIAALALNRPDEAFADTMLTFRIAKALADEPRPLLLNMRFIALHAALQSMWEGLTRRQWKDAQLAKFEEQLAGVHMARHFQHSVRGECILSMLVIDGHRASKIKRADSILLGVPGSNAHNKTTLARYFDRCLQYVNSTPLRFDRRPIVDELLSKDRERWTILLFDRKWLAELMAMDMNRLLRLSASTQAGVSLARIAIALERHRLLHGDYPVTLAALDDTVVPDDGLPTDVTDGTPAHYKRISAERFLLYFNGWDGSDEGGKLGVKHGWIDDPAPKQPIDWVWPMPAENQN